jgi:hypothetical protein
LIKNKQNSSEAKSMEGSQFTHEKVKKAFANKNKLEIMGRKLRNNQIFVNILLISII